MSTGTKTVIVTGAGGLRGIGRATVLGFAAKGYRVAAADLDLAGARRTAEEAAAIGAESLAVQVDVSNEESVANMVHAVIDAFGKIDILVNNAGISGKITLADMTLADFRRVLEVNLIGTFNCIKAVMEHMKANGWGRIVNMSSVGAKQGVSFGGPHYVTSKAAILGLSKAAALELAPYGITVNSVTPGLIATDIRMNNGLSIEAEAALSHNKPMKRAGTPEEVAAAIIFLASDEASFITAEDIDINGGAYVD